MIFGEIEGDDFDFVFLVLIEVSHHQTLQRSYVTYLHMRIFNILSLSLSLRKRLVNVFRKPILLKIFIKFKTRDDDSNSNTYASASFIL